MTRVRTDVAVSREARPGVSETLRLPSEMLAHLLGLEPAPVRRKFAKGQALYRQDEVNSRIYVVLSGRVGVNILHPDGQELLIDILGPGALCGEGAAFDGLPCFSSANALEKCEALAIPAADFYNAMSLHAELAQLVVQAIALKQRMLAMRLALVTQDTPAARIIRLFSQITAPSVPTIALTHQQIANLIGASRVTVTRAMQKLQREGAVRCRRGRYELISAPYSGCVGDMLPQT